MRRYLITGASGQLGYELTKMLGDSAMPKPRESFDVTEYKKVREWLPTLRPDMVIHCAGASSVGRDESIEERQRCWAINAMATDNMVKSCAASGIPFMFISTNRVFGLDGTRNQPYCEDDAVGPIGIYGQSKAAGEHAIMRLGQCCCPEYWKKGFRYWVIRTANMYERPWREYRNVPNTILRHGESRSSVPAHDRVYSSFTYAPHLAQAICYIIKHQREIVSGVYHIANAEAASYYEFATELARYAKKKINIIPQSVDKDANIANYSVLDCGRFVAEAGGPQLPSWKEALSEYAHELKRK